MERKQEKKQIKRKRLAMSRRISLIIGWLITSASVIILPLIQNLTNIPLQKWQGSFWYYAFLTVFIVLLFGGLWLWGEATEKTDVDDLEDTMDKHFGDLEKHIDRLIEEIRQDRKYRRR